jgi:hypothetical protein
MDLRTDRHPAREPVSPGSHHSSAPSHPTLTPLRRTHPQAKNDLSTIAGCKRILSDAGAQLPAAGDTYDDLLLLAAATVKRQRQTGGRLTNTKVSTEDKVVRAITVAELIRLSSAIEAGTEANKTVGVKGTLSYVPGKLLVKRCGRGGGKLFGCSWQTSNDVCGKCQAPATNEAFHEWLFEFTLQDWDNETVSADVLAVVKGGVLARSPQHALACTTGCPATLRASLEIAYACKACP